MGLNSHRNSPIFCLDIGARMWYAVIMSIKQIGKTNKTRG